MLEIETKIIDINPAKIRMQFKAKKVKFLGKVLLKRWMFALPMEDGEDNYIRIRTDGTRTTLSHKFRKGKGLRNTKELEIEISDFDGAVQIMSKVLKKRYYHENLREMYSYKGLDITMDKWPGIPAYLEIEGRSVKQIRDGIKELGIRGTEIGNISMIELYKHYGKDVHDPKFMPKK